jgi:DNA polymerase III subunit delta
MTEIHHHTLHQYLKETDCKSLAPAHLVYGEDFLYEQSVKLIVDAIIPDITKQRHGHEIIRHQDSSQIVDVIEKLNTYAFLNQKKIIELRDSNIFVSSRNQGKFIDKIKKAYDNSDMVQASRYYLELLGRLKINPEDISDNNILDLLGIESNVFPDVKWLLTLTEDAKKNNQTAIQHVDESGLLEKALVCGFPKNNFLIIATDTVDKRSSLYQAIKKIGVIVDCSVSKGSRKIDKDIQRQTLVTHMNQQLKKHGKEMDPEAFDLLYEKIGFDIRVFSGCLEKAIQYTGDRTTIHLRDVEAVSHQVRQDPIYELTGAIMERNIEKSIYYLSSLLDSGYHPLQILAAITNQFRRALIIKDFLKSPSGRAWRKGIRFDQFQNDVIPEIRQYDHALLNHFNENEYFFWEKSDAEHVSQKQKISSDLILLKKDQHPYAVYILFLKADIFEENEISMALMNLSQADAAMKTSGQRPTSILQEAIIKICRPKNL